MNCFTDYLGHSNLEAGEETVLFARFDSQAKDRVVKAHLKLVLSIASPYRRLESFSDLVQEGALALVESIERFDPARGCRFSTYARHRIRGRIKSHLRSLSPKRDWVPAPASDRSLSLGSWLARLDQSEASIVFSRYERGMSWREIAKETGLSHEGARKRHDKIIRFLREEPVKGLRNTGRE